jgi:hypothetical protein
MNNIDEEESSNESENYFNLTNVSGNKGKQEASHLQKKRRKGKSIINANNNETRAKINIGKT